MGWVVLCFDTRCDVVYPPIVEVPPGNSAIDFKLLQISPSPNQEISLSSRTEIALPTHRMREKLLVLTSTRHEWSNKDFRNKNGGHSKEGAEKLQKMCVCSGVHGTCMCTAADQNFVTNTGYARAATGTTDDASRWSNKGFENKNGCRSEEGTQNFDKQKVRTQWRTQGVYMQQQS